MKPETEEAPLVLRVWKAEIEVEEGGEDGEDGEDGEWRCSKKTLNIIIYINSLSPGSP